MIGEFNLGLVHTKYAICESIYSVVSTRCDINLNVNVNADMNFKFGLN